MSDTTLGRPGFQQMVEQVNAGLEETVIVNDKSRLGRDYLKIGFYTEIAFPEVNVRFIAVNKDVDRANQVESDLTPFINIFYEFYIKDTSMKIHAVFKAEKVDGYRRQRIQIIYNCIEAVENPNEHEKTA